MRLLFAKQSLAYPRSSGQDVHAYGMMRACAAIGHDVSLATFASVSAEATHGLDLTRHVVLDAPHDRERPLPMTRLQEKFRRFYGVPRERIRALAELAEVLRPDAVVAVGLEALPYLTGLSPYVRVWYAADEWVWHHLTQLTPNLADLRSNLRDAAVKGVYERAYAGVVDRVWVVSKTEQRAMKWFAGMPTADVLPNGVDAEFYAPDGEPVAKETAVFWGRLDFGPNIQALQWFCRRVWPLVRVRAPGGTFTIVGFNPSAEVRELTREPGVSLAADLPDIRPVVRRHAVVVLPFVSGGGIKNKLLEAAALGSAIVCTPAAAHGLRAADRAPLRIARSPRHFADEIVAAWGDDAHRQQLGRAAREWVMTHHTWEAAATEATSGLRLSLQGRS